MDKIFVKDFVNGWLIGDFEPSLLKNKLIEVAIQSYQAGDEEAEHYHKIGTEISIVITGSALFNNDVVNAGEGIIINPKKSNIFKAITDCNVLVIKYPSDTNDKYLGEYFG